jgi:protein gp37
MGNKSEIQWTDATWNVARGCTKVDADCKYCYMYRQSLNDTRYKADEVIKTKTVFTLPLHYRERHSKCWSGNPLIFTSSLTDFFHEAIDTYRNEAWDIIRKCPHLTFQILTKRPERIRMCLPADWGEGWDNVWLGTSVGTLMGVKRIDYLLEVPSKTHFLSAEPLTEYFNLDKYLYNRYQMGGDRHMYNKLSWVILGGESGNDVGKYKYRPCEIGWLQQMALQCINANVPVFVKQVGTHLAKQMGMTDRHGGNIDEFPESIKFREFPNIPYRY